MLDAAYELGPAAEEYPVRIGAPGAFGVDEPDAESRHGVHACGAARARVGGPAAQRGVHIRWPAAARVCAVSTTG